MNIIHDDSDTSAISKKIPFWSASLLLLGLLVFAYGVMLHRLGFAFDDWHFIYYATRGYQGISEILHYDGHAHEIWLYNLSFKILGYKPLYWHLWTLIWRWLAVLSFWLCLQATWHLNHRRNFFAAALFALHPIYTLQVFPICFFDVWVAFTLLFLSFYVGILAIQHPEKDRLFTSIAVALAIGRIFASEYVLFVELMRPVFIWLALPAGDPPRKKTTQSIIRWIPFFLVFIFFLIWRGFFSVSTRKYFQVPADLFSSPFKYVLGWSLDLLPDMSNVLVTAWFDTFHADYLYFARPFNIILFVVLLCVAVLGAVYLYKLDAVSKSFEAWTIQAMVLGLPSMVLGILPFYIASYSIHLTEPPFNSRFALGMLPGAALITAALIEILVTKQHLKIMISVIVLGMAVSWHIRYTNDYRKVWEYQAGLLQQLTWRAPGLEKGTAVFIWQPTPPKIENSFAGIAISGEFPLAMAINSIYDPQPVPTNSRLSYWYYPLAGDVFDMSPATPLHAEHDTTVFDGNTSDGLFLYYDPTNNRCLHLISAEDQYYQQYPSMLRQIAIQANTDQVMPMLNQNVALRDEILGTHEHTWCYYYQKAEVARQYQHWDSIPLLWQMATDEKLSTNFGTEYIPFIDGFAQLAEWQQAQKLTSSARKLSKGMDSLLCPLWSEINQSTLPSDQRTKTINDMRNLLNCSIQ